MRSEENRVEQWRCAAHRDVDCESIATHRESDLSDFQTGAFADLLTTTECGVVVAKLGWQSITTTDFFSWFGTGTDLGHGWHGSLFVSVSLCV